jgi:cytochrome c5
MSAVVQTPPVAKTASAVAKTAESAPSAFAVVGLFSRPDKILAAAKQLRSRKLGRLEAYTPYPVHGLDSALGMEPSGLGKMVLAMGVLGAILALAFEGWVSAIDYPLVVGGKPLFSWQAFVPVVFEVTVLFATFTAGLAMLFLFNKLPFFGHPVLHSPVIKKITRDKLALSIERDRDSFDVESARQALADLGAESVEVVPVPPVERPLTLVSFLRTTGAIVAACVVAGVGAFFAIKAMPIVPPMVRMQDQPKLNAFKTSDFFSDHRGMRLPVPDTVARGHLPPAFTTPEEAGSMLANPLPLTEKTAERGRKVFGDHCAICHGSVGDGKPLLSRAYGGQPKNLISSEVREKTDGYLYGVIVRGKNAMPSYAPDLDENDRWAAVHYIRVLQRSQDAKDEDLR